MPKEKDELDALLKLKGQPQPSPLPAWMSPRTGQPDPMLQMGAFEEPGAAPLDYLGKAQLTPSTQGGSYQVPFGSEAPRTPQGDTGYGIMEYFKRLRKPKQPSVAAK